MRSFVLPFIALALPFAVACGGAPSPTVGSTAAEGVTDPDSGSAPRPAGATCTSWDQCESQKCYVVSGEETGVCQGPLGTACTSGAVCETLSCGADGTCVESCSTYALDEGVPCCYGFSCVATDGGGADAGPAPACYQNVTPAGLPAWKRPTSLHQAACWTKEIAAYVACAGTEGCTSGYHLCDECLVTAATAREYGPVVTGTPAGTIINWGGCQAHLDGHESKTSCGAQTNAWQACVLAECAACGDDLDTCATYAAGALCASSVETPSCQDEWAASDVAASCSDLTTMATLWCGD
jgi:hypothetical protein